MDILLGISVAVFIFCLLLFAAIRDFQTREVPNWVWLLGLLGLPLTILRLVFTGLLPPYGLQALLVFFLVIISFRVGVLGGADGKAVLVISFLYPWIVLDSIWLLVAPVMVLIGVFLLVGLHSLWLLLRNILTWKRVSKRHVSPQKPTSKAYWLIRTLSIHSEEAHWKRVDVPLIVYFFLVFTLLLISTSVLL